ncbi:MAG: hypothetical protein QXS27_08155 [Candidatus Jordarchaeaceae archaeon]
MADEAQNIYMDTCYLQAWIGKDEDAKKSVEPTIQKIKNSLTNPQIHVKVPMIVVGELINNLIKNRIGKFSEIIRDPNLLLEVLVPIRDLNADLVPPSRESFNLVAKLLHADERLEPTDSLILAQVICDPDSSHFLTTDGLILQSAKIKELMKSPEIENKRKRKLRITAGF